MGISVGNIASPIAAVLVDPTTGSPYVPTGAYQPVRAICVGDSQQSMGFYNHNAPTTAGSMVVSNGIATIVFSGNHNQAPGNYVTLYNTGDTLFSNPSVPSASSPINGICVPVLTAPANNTITVSATYNGVTVPNGDYSSLNSTGWIIHGMTEGTDSSVLQFLKYRSGNPIQFVANYGIIGGYAAWQVSILPKILAGPKFELAIVNAGTNEVGGGAPLTPVTKSLASAQDAYGNIVTLCNAMLNYGARVILITGFPIPATVTNAINSNIALNQLRQQLIGFGQATQGVTVFDTWKDSVLGTSTTGDFVSNFAHSATDVHLSSFGGYVIGGQETAVLTSLARPIELSPISAIDDANTYAQVIASWAASTNYTVTTTPALYVVNTGNLYRLVSSGQSASSGGPQGTAASISDGTCVWTYAGMDTRNLVAHGMMDGTGGTVNSGFGASQTAPTGWNIPAPTNCTGTSASQQTRQGATGTNQSLWGYGWNINATFSAAGALQIQSNDWGSLWRSASANFGGGWFRAGITVTALGNFSAINLFRMIVKTIPSGGAYAQVSVWASGNNTTTIPMQTNDVAELYSEPFYIAPGTASAQSQMFLDIQSSGAGAANFQLANAWCRRVVNPYSY